jgi:hypothetical protein
MVQEASENPKEELGETQVGSQADKCLKDTPYKESATFPCTMSPRDHPMSLIFMWFHTPILTADQTYTHRFQVPYSLHYH